MFLHCTNCKSPIDGPHCSFCGQESGFTRKVEEEAAHLSKFKKKLTKIADDKAIDLLIYGFMPQSSEVLLSAGLDMVALIEAKERDKTVLEAAVGRLSAIAIRLKLMGSPNEAIAIALEVFEHDLSKNDRREHIYAIMYATGGLIFLCIFFMVCGTVYSLAVG